MKEKLIIILIFVILGVGIYFNASKFFNQQPAKTDKTQVDAENAINKEQASKQQNSKIDISPNLKKASRIMNYYYTNKNYEDALFVLNSVDEFFELQKNQKDHNVMGPIMFFFVGLISDDPKFVEFVKQQQLSKGPSSFINEVVDKREYLKKSLFSDKITPELLDFLWGYFGATGDEEALKKIASALDYKVENGKAGPEGFFAIAAAWSLSARAKHEPKVKKFVDELKKDPNFSNYNESVKKFFQ